MAEDSFYTRAASLAANPNFVSSIAKGQEQLKKDAAAGKNPYALVHKEANSFTKELSINVQEMIRENERKALGKMENIYHSFGVNPPEKKVEEQEIAAGSAAGREEKRLRKTSKRCDQTGSRSFACGNAAPQGQMFLRRLQNAKYAGLSQCHW